MDDAGIAKRRSGKDVVADIVARIIPRISAILLSGKLHPIMRPPQTDVQLTLDLKYGLFGKDAHEELVDGRLAELGAKGELVARNALARNILAYRLGNPAALCIVDWHG